MPRESVVGVGGYPDYPQSASTAAPSSFSLDAIRVDVGWSKWPAGAVQIGVVNERIHDAEPGNPDGGWFASLDRVTINELIRKLRVARDQAFGRDE